MTAQLKYMEEEKRRGKRRKFFVIFIGLFLFVLVCSTPWWGCRVFCYDSVTAHPNIAQLAALLYNKTYPDKKLTAEEINWIMLGSEKEDTPTRWLNHFYDPINNKGLMFEKQHLSAKAWAVNSKEQTNYALGDKSWPRALADLNKGNREEAFKELGHILHLIADMSVPAHTRADAHVMPGDSYESFVRLNWDTIQKQISSQFIEVSSLNQAFDDLANYSNNNFYSDDTIESSDYNKIKILKNNLVKGLDGAYYNFYFAKDEFGNYYKLYFSKDVFNWQSSLKGVGEIEKKLKHDDISLDYSTHLIPKAIGTSAGVIKLFFSEAEKSAQVELPKNRVSVWGWGNLALGWGVSVAIDAKNYLMDKFGGNNQAVGQMPAVITPPTVIPSVTEGSLKDGNKGIPPLAPLGRNDNVVVPPVVVKKVLGEKIVVPVIPVTPVISVIPSEVEGSLKDDGQGISPLAPLGRNDNVAQGGGSYSGGGGGTGGGTEILNQVQDDTANTTTTITTTTPPLAPPQGGGDSASSTTATSTVGADPCASAEASCDTQSSSSTPWNGGVTTTPSGADPSLDALDDSPPTTPTITFTDALEFGLDYNLILTVTSTDASSSPVYFDIEYLSDADFSTPSSTWQILTASSTEAVHYFTAEANKKYVWRARAKDRAGNISAWSADNLFVGKNNFGKQVVINEVAWAGTAGFSQQYINDKWLELYNNTDSPINIAGWKLYIGNVAVSPVQVTTTVIEAHGYYLMERSMGSSWDYRFSDDTIMDIPGDYIFWFDANNFKLTGERLRLVDATGKIIDEVDCSAGWFTNNTDGLYRTMERINSRQSGNDPANWQSNHGPRPLGRGRGGATIYGSARQPNVGNVVLMGNQPEITRTLTSADNPYFISDYTVPAGKTLIVEPGVVIKSRFSNAPLRVAGRLEIKGTIASPVVITSGRDQTFVDPKLNKVFGSWANGPAVARDWQGLWFDPGAVGEIAGLELRYAGYKFQPPRVDHWFGSSVEQSIRVDGATINISDSNILNNGNTALYLEKATTTIQNTKIDQGIMAINALDGVVSFDNVKISNFTHANGPLGIVRSFPSFKNLQLENNSFDGVFLENPTFRGETTLGKELLWSLSYPVIPVGSILHLAPGAKLLLLSKGVIEVNGGRLLAEGTADEPVEIKPLVAGGYWGGFRFTDSDSVLENVRLVRGNNVSNSSEGLVFASNSQLKLKNITIEQLQTGKNIIKSENSQVDLDAVNLGYEVKPLTETCAVDIKNGTLKLRSVYFKNLTHGLYALPASLPELDMTLEDSLSVFENIDVPMLPAYPWIKVPPAPLPELPW